MNLPKLQPVKSAENLRERVVRFFCNPGKNSSTSLQLDLELSSTGDLAVDIDAPANNVKEFIDFISDSIPSGGVYLFGGILRDLALLGKRGFDSDIDLVVEGDWGHLVKYLEHMNAHKNKFGGYRLSVAGWPIDIWNAEETWAIKQKLVPYLGISSLTETTVLNWDAILMNWRTREFICREKYFEEINLGVLDVVLEENPNPLGMAVRVFRHAFLKEAKKLTPMAIKYLVKCANKYTFEQLRDAELKSYRNTVIQRSRVNFFKNIDVSGTKDLLREIDIASDIFKQEVEFAQHKLIKV